MSSKVLAKIALMIPAKAKNKADKNNITTVKSQSNKPTDKNMYETIYIITAFKVALNTLPKAKPSIITHVGVGEITISSMFFKHFGGKQ